MRWTKISNPNYFADSYALISLLKGDQSYEAYSSAELVYLKVNLAEVAYSCIKEGKMIEEVFGELFSSVIPLSISSTLQAVKLKYRFRKKKLSYIDCLGYATAQELGIPFLTGDKAFVDMPGVEFCS